MDKKDILKYVDHTCLRQDCTINDIKILCEEAQIFGTASVCIPPCFVKEAHAFLKTVPICTVIGFPNGYNSTRTKLFECEDAIKNGADEIDTVINITDLKSGKYDVILTELTKLKNICQSKTLKVIVETCLLTLQEKIDICNLVYDSGADYIKTSTGFSKGGATIEDVKLFKELHNDLKVKGAGGISDFAFAEQLINIGCSRIGASKLVKIYKDSLNV